MAVTYKLQIHSRDVLNIGNYTGYDLITIYEDGSQTVQYINLYSIRL